MDQPHSLLRLSATLSLLLFLPTLITPSPASSSSDSSSTDSQDYFIHDAAAVDPGEYTPYLFNPQTSVHGDMPYPADYTSEWAKRSGRMQAPKCVTIPDNLTLCNDIGYPSMLLPNHLEHDTMKEVIGQASSWVPLERIKCHPDTKIFLCSLFSPICMDRPIFPCRSLCLGVKASCEYRMKAHGFEWPEMLDCDQFPEDNDMCINIVNKVSLDGKCSACNHPGTHESIIDHYCRADFAMRATLKEFKTRDGHMELVLRKKKRFLKKMADIPAKVARKLKPILEHGAQCECDKMNTTHRRYLLMGNLAKDDLLLTFGMPWNRKDKELKKGLRAMRKGNLCKGGIFKEISNNNGGLEPIAGPPKKDRKKRRNREGKKDKKKRKKKNKKRRRGGKKGKRNRRGRKGKGKGRGKGKGKKNRGNKGNNKNNNKNNDNSNNGNSNNSSRRGNKVKKADNAMSTSQKEDQALRNFERVAK